MVNEKNIHSAVAKKHAISELSKPPFLRLEYSKFSRLFSIAFKHLREFFLVQLQIPYNALDKKRSTFCKYFKFCGSIPLQHVCGII